MRLKVFKQAAVLIAEGKGDFCCVELMRISYQKEGSMGSKELSAFHAAFSYNEGLYYYPQAEFFGYSDNEENRLARSLALLLMIEMNTKENSK